MTDRTALVLGGGGVTGISWEIGVLHGLAAGADRAADLVTAPDLVIGTSAGSVVGVHVAAGTDLDELYAAQWAPAAAEIAAPIDTEGLAALMTDAAAGATDALEVRRRIGAAARQVDDGVAEARRAAILARLPRREWPPRPLRLTVVDVDSGEIVVFDRTSGVGLADAVAASCAVPGVWPVVEIDGRGYMDGGAASICHAGLAAGHDRVLVLAPFPERQGPEDPAVPGLDADVAALRAAGADVTVVGPDPDYLAGPGATPLDPAGRPSSAEAGERFARRVRGAGDP